MTLPASLSMVAIGLRDMVPSIDLFPVNKTFCKFDISGDALHPIYTGTHAVLGGSCNIFEVITIELEVPLDLEFAPVLTVYVYDNMMGVFGERLVGVANIPLYDYCRGVLEKAQTVTSLWKSTTLKNTARKPEEVTKVKAKLASLMKDERFLALEQHDKKPGDDSIIAHEEKKSVFKSFASGLGSKVIDLNQLQLDVSQDSQQQAILELDKEQEVKEAKRLQKMAHHRETVRAEEQRRREEAETVRQQKAQAKFLEQAKAREKATRASFLAEQDDYNSDPEAVLEETPEWLKGREWVDDELENTIARPPFNTSQVFRGQTRGKASTFSKTVENNVIMSCTFKNILKIKSQESLTTEGDKEFQEFITPKG